MFNSMPKRLRTPPRPNRTSGQAVAGRPRLSFQETEREPGAPKQQATDLGMREIGKQGRGTRLFSTDCAAG